MFCLVKMGSSKAWIAEEVILHTTVYKNYIATLGATAEYLPEKIVSTAYFGEVQYLVKWQGWDERHHCCVSAHGSPETKVLL
jgi:hypothetical protein